jgi:hypothetical protein
VVRAARITVGTDILEVNRYYPEQTMPDDGYEPNRFLGFPVRSGPRAKRHGESQRVMGFPVDWFGSVAPAGRAGRDGNVAPVGSDGSDQVWPLAHPIRGYKRWLRRRRLGPYAVDEDQRH